MAEYVPWNKACSFTCPLTCEGPGDPDHESQADRTARLAGTLRRNKASNNDTPAAADAPAESVYSGRDVQRDAIGDAGAHDATSAQVGQDFSGSRGVAET